MSFPEHFKHIPNKDFSTYTFDVLNANKVRFVELLEKLGSAMDESNNIPTGLLIELKNLIVPAGYNKHLANHSRISEITNKVVDYFTTTEKEEYFFDGIAESAESELTSERYNLNNLFLHIIIDYFDHKDEDEYLQKDFLLEIFYIQIREYRNSLSGSDIELEKFGHYKMAVMAAYLTLSLGFKICNAKVITHTALYQSSRNCLDKFNK